MFYGYSDAWKETLVKHSRWADVMGSLVVDEAVVAATESVLEAQLAGCLLRELRVQQGLTQAQVAGRMAVSQRRVSAIERGDIDHTEVDTIRSYVAALGGSVHLVAEVGDQIVRIAPSTRT